MKLLQIILLIILLIISALLIAINLKLYRINDIKRGGQVSEDVLINTYGNVYELLPEYDKLLFNVYLYNTIGDINNEEFNNIQGKENLLNMWIESQRGEWASGLQRGEWEQGEAGYGSDGDEDMQNAVAASLLDAQSKFTLPSSQVEYDRLYNLWIRSSSLLNSIRPDIERTNIEIQCTFPNFFSRIISDTIDINNWQLHYGLKVRRHGFKDSNIYFDIKYTIWMYCIKNNLIHDNVENRNCFFLNAELDACDLNGWILQSFTHTSDIYSFIIDKIGNMEKIVFIPRSDKSMSSFVKNIIFGRMETMGTTNSEELIHARYYGSRQVFGDGNCYYTAFMFNLLEFALFSGRINGIRQRIAKNIIDALISVQSDIQEQILIYDRENNNDRIISKKDMQKYYTFMLAKLTIFFETANSIFELERLFNKQDPYGNLVGIYLPLVYGCKLLIAKYMLDNCASTPEGIQTTLFDIVPKKIKYDGPFFDKNLILRPFLNTNILRINYDMEDITNLPILAYSFKCKQLLISDDNLQRPYVNYTKYEDPYTRIHSYRQLMGATNLILRAVAFHYDIVYHCSDTTIPKPIFLLDGGLAPTIVAPTIVAVKSIPLPDDKIMVEDSEQQLAIYNALLTLSYTDLDKLIKCKQKRIHEYKNSAAHTYYVKNIGDSHRYTTEEDNNKNELNEKILEMAEHIKLIISQAIEYYNMQDIITNNNKDCFINLLRTLKVEINIDKDDKIIIEHYDNAPIITKERVRELFLEHSDI